MKKCKLYLFFFVLLFVGSFITVDANEEYSVTLSGKVIATFNVRSTPSTANKKNVLRYSKVDDLITISKYTTTSDDTTGCETGVWFYVTDYSGWVCSNGIQITTTPTIMTGEAMSKLTDEEFNAYLIQEGFPVSYHESLKKIHSKYKNWVFKGINTYRDWNLILNDESEVGMSTFYISVAREKAGYEAYLDTEHYYNWETNWFDNYDGSFFLANKQAVAYYLDPRNFLTEKALFMFEGQNYNENSAKAELITAILGTDKYTDTLLKVGKEYDISPVFLASRIVQEGSLSTKATQGIGVTCKSATQYSASGSLKYEGPLYNFYNIGAYSSPQNAALNGLCYAAQTDTSTFRPWNTIEKALKGGAVFIGSSYINRGQYTTYFQKYNVSPTTSSSLGHQYMTNIEDPYSTSKNILYPRYQSLNALTNDFVFYIPYYINMPDEVSKAPTLGNPNNWLTSLLVDGVSVENFKGNVTSYNVSLASDAKELKIDATTVAKTSYVAINGNTSVLKTDSKTVTLTEELSSIDVVVTAANGDIKTYTLNLVRNTGSENENTETITPEVDTPVEEPIQPTVSQMLSLAKLKYNDDCLNGIKIGTTVAKIKKTLLAQNELATIKITNASGKEKTSGKLVTGDILIITSNNETETITIILYGDTNGDGQITIQDLLQIRKHILKTTKLTGVYKEAADVNKDGNITIQDLLQVRKDILNIADISQV